MSIASEQLAQITARAGVARASTARSAVAPKVYELKANGEIIWNRPTAPDGNPSSKAAAYTTGRE